MFMLMFFCFFFFKQKTAYEMRISDWSSDVCSSDLFQGSSRFDIAQGFANVLQRDPADFLLADNRKYIGFQPSGDEGLVALAPAGSSRLYPGPRRLFKATQDNRSATEASHALPLPPLPGRIDSRGELLLSEERRVGKESVSTCSYR